jgi:hypothetical protein
MSISVRKTNRRSDSGKHLYVVNADDVHKAFDDIFSVYCSEVIENIKLATNETAIEIQQTLVETSPKDDGEYALGWDWAITKETPFGETNAVYNRTSWQKIHLLEFGHQSRNQWNGKAPRGRPKLKTSKRTVTYRTEVVNPPASYGFVQGKPHVIPAWEKGGQIYVQKVKEAIADAK